MRNEVPPATPSRALRTYARLSGWLFATALGSWLALGLTAALLHGFIVPRIDQWRPWLETRASQSLGMPLRIGRITAHSSGLLPSFDLSDIALLGADGTAPLTIARARVSVSALSLWRLGVEHIAVDQPKVHLTRQSNGELALGSLRLGGGADAVKSSTDSGGDDAIAWLLAQPELLIEHGSVRVSAAVDASGPIDASRHKADAAMLRLDDLRLVLRNRGRRHAVRLDAQLDASRNTGSSGDSSLTLIAQLRAPLLTMQAGRWLKWNGHVYADLPPTDLAALATLAGIAPVPQRGQVALRFWAELRNSDWLNASADVRVADLALQLPDTAAPLAVQQLGSRLDWQRLDGGSAWHARQLVLVDGRGERWPGSELKFSHQHGQSAQSNAGTLSADRIDLTQLAGFARSLPLTADVRATLTRLAPKGVIDGLDIGWNGPPQVFPPLRFQASGHARGIEFAAQPAAARAGVHSNPGVPGLSGADIAFDLNQDGGQATLRMTAGTATFPGIFEEPTVPFAQLSTAVTWQRRDGQWEVTAPDLKFANADTAGSARVRWRSDTPTSTPTPTPTAPPKKASPAAAATGSPGSIELDGNLERGNVARLHRYLPLELPGPVRRYLRDALSAGSTSAVRFQVKGALRDFPYVDAKRGQFRLVAQLRDTTFVYAPPSTQPAGEMPWPPLTQLNGELVLERTSLQVNRARGRLGSGASGLPIGAASASIADFDQPRVRVDASTQAPLSDLLNGMRNSPLDAMLDQALRTASGSGNAQLKVQLNLPIEQIERATVQGSLTLAGNDLRMDADGLELKRVHGDIAFTERGFQLNGLDAQLFGGPVHIEGGSTTAPRSDSGPATALVEVRARGTASAQGLRAAPNAGPLAQIAQALNGAADYDAQLRVLRGGTELTVTSDLRGLAIELPAPLGKSAETALALRYENTPVFTERAGAVAQDRLALRLGDVASLDYRRALHTDGARVLRGSVALGSPAAAVHALPASGVAAHVELARFEPGRWNDALAAWQHAPEPAAGRKSGQPSATTSPAAASTANMRSYWPSQWQARVGTFASENVALHRLSLDGTREGTVWRSTAQADELAGRLEFRESADGGPGRLLARLSRLRLANPDVVLASSAVSPRVGAGAGAVTAATEELPALDVVVDRFELQGRDLGRLEIDAVNQPAESGAAREWSLKKLVLTVPEATFTAQGKWTQPPTAGVGSAARDEKPRTALDFKLDLNDSGRLLERFGMKDVVRQGRGEMLGWLVWNGSPMAFDYPTLGGRFHLDVAAGQFLKVEPGFAKLLGVLSLQALPRRLSLDFRDLFSSGFAFDFVRGDVLVQRGVASSNNLQMKGASAAVLMDGLADIEAETQSLKVVVVPEIDAGTAALVATAINPALGLGTFLAQYFLRKPLSRAATRVFQIDGTWSDPRITKVTGRSNPDEVQAGPPMAADSGH